jgi:hypothetical protein
VKILFTIVFILSLLHVSIAQSESQDSLSQIKKPKFYNPLEFSGLSLQHAICAYPNIGSANPDHADIVFGQTAPDPEWSNLRSAFRHEMRADIDLRIYFSHQLFNKDSFLYGNFYTGLLMSYGNRLNLSYISEYKSLTPDGVIDENPVTDIDTVFVRQLEYMQNSIDLGISMAYAISSPPNNDLAGEIGLGAAFLYSLSTKGIQNEISSVRVKFTDQYNREEQTGTIDTETSEFNIQPCFYARLFVPASFSYRFGTRRKLALSSFLIAGAEMHFTDNGQKFIYPFYSLGLGLRWFL